MSSRRRYLPFYINSRWRILQFIFDSQDSGCQKDLFTLIALCKPPIMGNGALSPRSAHAAELFAFKVVSEEHDRQIAEASEAANEETSPSTKTASLAWTGLDDGQQYNYMKNLFECAKVRCDWAAA
jgi:hypothetical protein